MNTRYLRAVAALAALLLAGCVAQPVPVVVTVVPYADADGCVRAAVLADLQSLGEQIVPGFELEMTQFSDGRVHVVVESLADCPTPAAVCEQTSCWATEWILTVAREGATCRVLERGSRRQATMVTTYADCPTATPAFWPTGMPPPTRGPTAVPLPMPSGEAACRRQGGWWQKEQDLISSPGCYGYHTEDAGRSCSDDRECQGWCDPHVAPMELYDLKRDQAAVRPILMTGECSMEANPSRAILMSHLVDAEVHLRGGRE